MLHKLDFGNYAYNSFYYIARDYEYNGCTDNNKINIDINNNDINNTDINNIDINNTDINNNNTTDLNWLNWYNSNTTNDFKLWGNFETAQGQSDRDLHLDHHLLFGLPLYISHNNCIFLFSLPIVHGKEIFYLQE